MAVAISLFCNISINIAAAQSLPGLSLPPTDKHEVRAVWLTTLKNLDWPKTLAKDNISMAKQKEELRQILDKYRQANINTVLFQTVVRATTVYPSSIEPWDACMTGRQGGHPGYDPLAFAIEECHKRGMEIQAWIATLPVGPYDGNAAKRLRRLGYKMFKLEGDAFLDPSSPKTGDLVASLAREITTHYDIDGIHLDYIRYPEMLPVPKNESISQWRRNNITEIVRKVHDAVKDEKPWVKISCSPIGKYSDLSRYSSNNWNARDRVSQDAQLWLRTGIMDQIYPMIYFRGNNFYPFAADWAENSHGRTVVAGLGTYFLNSREGGKYGWTIDDIRSEMTAARWLGIGTAHFRSAFFTSNEQGIYNFASLCFAPYPALVPSMKWECSDKPSKPLGLTIVGDRLTISDDRNVGRSISYNLYASDLWPVDTESPENLFLCNIRSKEVKLPTNTLWRPRFFAVTATDRYGNESAPIQSWTAPKPAKGQLVCDNSYVVLSKSMTDDIKKGGYDLVISNAKGQNIMRKKILYTEKDGKIDVRNLPDGIYFVRLSRNEIKRKTENTHPGFFIIRR